MPAPPAERFRRLEELFEVAIATPREQRAAFLDQACGTDLQLRAEIDALLAADEVEPTFAAAVGSEARDLAAALAGPQLAAGARLGRYEILAPLGAGGMGEVWRARDSRLGREVALKLLPRHLTADADALSRFEREAKAVAALSHPNILAIHDFERDGEIVFAVTELLEGETLREVVRAGPVPARKVREWGGQVARALAAAHDRGIVHRDVKPENLFLTRDGVVKLLDFGVARRRAPHAGLGDTSKTALGTVLGTVGYMSPEQVRGEVADPRADLFALGCVLYELSTGERAFAAASAAETLSHILTRDPPHLEELASTSPELERILRRCLEKRPEDRFRSAHDLAFALLGSEATPPPVVRQSTKEPAATSTPEWPSRVTLTAAGHPRFVAAVLLIVSLAGAAAAGWLVTVLWRPRGPAPTNVRPVFRQLTKMPGGELSPTIAPDGESFVFVKADGGDLDLFVQRVDGAKPIPLTAECAHDDLDPAFSPDGRTLAFHSDCDGGGVFVMGATGESRRRVTDFGFQPAWSPDGTELAVVTERLASPTSRSSASSQLWVVRTDTGVRRLVSEHDAMGPSWSPDGRRIAFWGLRATFQRDIWSVAADGSQRAKDAAAALLDDAAVDWAPAYTADGRWLTFGSSRGGTFNLWRLPVDPATGTASGSPEPLTAPSSAVGEFSLSADSRRLVFVDSNLETEIMRAPFDPTRLRLAGHPVQTFSGSFVLREQAQSPDGAWILFVNEDMPQQLHLVRPDGSGYRQLTEGNDRNRQGTWSPGGDRIVFQTTRGDSSLAAIRADGGGWQALPVGLGVLTPRWSPDGSTIAACDQKGAILVDVRRGFATAVTRSLPAIAPGISFRPGGWSADGSQLVGRAIGPEGPADVVVYSLATGVYRSTPHGRRTRSVDWIEFAGPHHIVQADDSSLWLVDVVGDAAVELYAAPGGRQLGSVSFTRDRRWLTWIEMVDESDVWLMTLDAPPAASGRR